MCSVVQWSAWNRLQKDRIYLLYQASLIFDNPVLFSDIGYQVSKALVKIAVFIVIELVVIRQILTCNNCFFSCGNRFVVNVLVELFIAGEKVFQFFIKRWCELRE